MKRYLIVLLTFSLIFTGCISSTATKEVGGTGTSSGEAGETTVPRETAPGAQAEIIETVPGRIVISELLPGVPGNNNKEFVELYNAGTEPVNLRGWSLWYKLADNQEEKRLILWSRRVDVPGYGHYLLVRQGQDVAFDSPNGIVPDIWFKVPLFERKGGIVLRNAEGEVVDALGWGEAPTGFVEGKPAPYPTNGASLARRPGGDAWTTADATFQDRDNNVEDFDMLQPPYPQGTGSPITPLPEQHLSIRATAPAQVLPGTTFEYHIIAENHTGTNLENITVVVPIPGAGASSGTRSVSTGVPADGAMALTSSSSFEVVEIPEGAARSKSHIERTFAKLANGDQVEVTLVLRSPWAYDEALLGGYYVESYAWPLRAYGPPVPITITGGAIPVNIARTLLGERVTVEGTATMYTGGFYAGTTGVKFYLQDETGGIQVYCPGGKGEVNVHIGDRMRVTGEIERYRSAMEIVPTTYPDDVELIAAATISLRLSMSEVSGNAEPPTTTLPVPQDVTIQAATSDESLLGRLIAVEGTLTRLEEFNYSYEVDLTDDQGDTILVYVEKDTRINIEPLEIGERYRVIGISEIYDTYWQIKPRVQEDFERLYPPVLMLEMVAPNNVVPGGLITYTYTAYNHTDTPLTDVQITALLPSENAKLAAILDQGSSGRHGTMPAVVWTVPELPPHGGSVTVRYVVRTDKEVQDPVIGGVATVIADQWPESVNAGPWTTFIGNGMPIWAIQGYGIASPYIHSIATTEGVVIGTFPELGGFWIQSLEPDLDDRTSEGLWIYGATLANSESPVTVGDYVQVTGKVREKSRQTLLDVEAPTQDIRILDTDVALPDPVELNPPQDDGDAAVYYEALEGMLVQVHDPAVAVAPTNQYGEYALIRPQWEQTHVMRDAPSGMLIFVDDGSAVTHENGTTLPYAVKTGDMVGDLLGPLAYTYDNYKIQPIITPTVIPMDCPLPAMEPTHPNELSIATFNAENFFDIMAPHPSDPPRPSLEAYRLKLVKTAKAIVAMGVPTIIGLQEIENIGVLEDLIEEPAIAQYRYLPALIEGTDSRGIDVAYLVRGDVATLEGISAYPAPEGVTSRPPLLITVTMRLAGEQRTVTVLNNHFTSMSGGERATEPRRIAQATWNVNLVNRLLAQNPEAYVVVLGDLNSYYMSPPLDVLREAGAATDSQLRHVYELIAPLIPYTYIYQGEAETLDHILVTPSLYRYLVYVGAVHINADYPLPMPDDTSARRVSDHDPLVAIFSFE